MPEQARAGATVHDLHPDAVLDVRDRLTQSATLIHGWLEALEGEPSEDALISPESLKDVVDGLIESLRGYADLLPDRNLPGGLSKMLIARCAELEFTMLALAELNIERSNPRWPGFLQAWVKATDLSVSACVAVADDVAKRLRGPRVRRAQADENNSTLINAVIFYRTDPRTDKPRSARTIASNLQRNKGFDAFTARRSDEALTRLVQRILRKAANP